MHVAFDDATRLACLEVLPDEQKATTVAFLTRAVGWFSAQGIICRRVLSDHGSSFRSGEWRKACSALDLKPISTRPYTRRTNGKAERFIKTLCWRTGRTPCRSRPQENGTAGCPTICRSITAAGATWPLVASAPSSACSFWLLNDLARKHI